MWDNFPEWVITMIVFLDTETTGLPIKRSNSAHHLSNWPRLVEIAWIECDDKGAIKSEEDLIIKPDSFEIPPEATAIHGITTKKAIKDGVLLKEALRSFGLSFNNAEFCVGHNIDFDVNIINAEFLRAKIFLKNFCIFSKPMKCTMKSSTKFCRLKNGYGHNKYPSLLELHTKLFGEPYEDTHNALNDARACMRCYFELHRRGIL